MSHIVMVCGVSGSGKTTIGKLLSKKIDIPFYDADDFHPKANVEKMMAGHPLNDEDRIPWLDAMAKQLPVWERGDGAVLGCSALKEKYRERLQKGAEHKIVWIMLEGTFELIKERMESRENHFFDADLLQSQFDAYERPEYGYFIDVSPKPEKIVENIIKELKANDVIHGL